MFFDMHRAGCYTARMPKTKPLRAGKSAGAGKKNKKASAPSPESQKNGTSEVAGSGDAPRGDPQKDVTATKRREEIRKLRKKRRSISFRLRPVHLFLIFILLLFVLGGVYLSQQTTMASIEDEKAEKQSVLDGLKVDEERLERMLEYMQTDQYMMQYAREKLGYVFDDDIKFYDPGAS